MLGQKFQPWPCGLLALTACQIHKFQVDCLSFQMGVYRNYCAGFRVLKERNLEEIGLLSSCALQRASLSCKCILVVVASFLCGWRPDLGYERSRIDLVTSKPYKPGLSPLNEAPAALTLLLCTSPLSCCGDIHPCPVGYGLHSVMFLFKSLHLQMVPLFHLLFQKHWELDSWKIENLPSYYSLESGFA